MLWKASGKLNKLGIWKVDSASIENIIDLELT